MRRAIKKVIERVFGERRDLLLRLRSPDRQLISKILESRLTYLSQEKLISITHKIRKVEDEKLHGSFVEAGCALGGSTILISKIKHPARPLYVYDVFDMIPPPTPEDGDDGQRRYQIVKSGHSKGIGNDVYYGYKKNLWEEVLANLQKFGVDEERDNVHLIKGLLQKTMRMDSSVAFALIDVDWYEPVSVCLKRIVPRLVVGGSLVLDDYFGWSGCRKAADEYFSGEAKRFFVMDGSSGSMKVTRIRAPVETKEPLQQASKPHMLSVRVFNRPEGKTW